MKELIVKTVDDGDFFELQPDYAKNIIIGFARMDGQTVGIVANQPLVLAGCLDIKSSSSRASCASAMPSTSRWSPSSTCPASCPAPAGIRRHHQARRQAALRLCRSTVPKITVITRKAYGGAYDVMASKHLRGDVNLAWPHAEIAVMGAKGAVEIIFREDKNDPKLAAAKPSTRPVSPTRGRRPWLHRRRDPAARDAQAHLPLAGNAQEQAAGQPVAQARQHPAVKNARTREPCLPRS
jgi:propionyl-CoA carboxylase beta chain